MISLSRAGDWWLVGSSISVFVPSSGQTIWNQNTLLTTKDEVLAREFFETCKRVGTGEVEQVIVDEA